MLDRNNGLPLNYQLTSLIKDDIASGRRQIGDKLPTVRELTAQYKVSLPVVRQALTTLQSEGLIELLHGKGAFVTGTPPKKNPQLQKIIFLMRETHALRSHYYMRVLTGVEKAATDRRLPVEFVQIKKGQPLPEILREMSGNPAFIICGDVGGETISRIEARNAVKVQIGDDSATAPDIVNDDFSGGYQVGRYFCNCGYRDCAIFLRDTETRYNRERLEGFRQALKENGQTLADENIVICGQQENIEAVLHILTEIKPDAIFATTDRLANLVLQTATRNGINVPGQIGLSGFDNDLFSAFLNPPLTTVNVDIEQLGEECLRLLDQRSQGGKINSPVRIGVNLIERESCQLVSKRSIAH